MGLKGVFFSYHPFFCWESCLSLSQDRLYEVASNAFFIFICKFSSYTSWGRRVLGREMEKQPRRSCRSVLVRAWKPGCCCCAAPQLCFAHGKALPCCTEPVLAAGGHCWGSSAIAWQHSQPQSLRVQQLCIHIC